jgi:hypothetical protein
MAVMEVVACDDIPGPSDDIVPEEISIIQMLQASNATPREQAEARLTRPDCVDCHQRFDPYGLALDGYDIIGRYRTQYDDGRPIDTSATLPPAFDDQQVTGPVDMSQKLAAGQAFATCMAKNMLQYALSDVTSAPVDVGSCPVAAVTARFQGSADRSYTTLIREVMLSPAAFRRLSTE